MSDTNGKPKCPHNIATHMVQTEGPWEVAVGPEACVICPTGEPCGIPVRTDGHAPPVKKKRTLSLTECRKPGCVLVVTKGRGHVGSPCLIIPEDAPDTVYEIKYQTTRGDIMRIGVKCPRCHAGPGDRCVAVVAQAGRPVGAKIASMHPERR